MATRLRSFRIEDELWERGLAASAAKGSDLSAELRAFIERMARNHEKKAAAEAESNGTRRRRK